MHRYKNISLSYCMLPQKNCQVRRPRAKNGRQFHHFVLYEMPLSRAIFLNVFESFYRKSLVVLHPCSNFSLRRQMAPLQSIKFQTPDFPILCARIIVIFLSNVYRYGSCSLVAMCVICPAGIAVPRRRHYFRFLLFIFFCFW